MKLRGNRFGVTHTAEKVLGTFQTITGDQHFSSKKKEWYVVINKTLIRRLSFKTIHDFLTFAKHLLRRRKLARSRCGAEYIRVKNNLLAFYPDKKKVIKVFNDTKAQKQHLSGYNHFRNCNPYALSVPKVYRTSSTPVNYTIESFVNGSTLSKPAKFSNHQINDILSFHLGNPDFRVRRIKKDDCLQLEKALSGIELTETSQSILKAIQSDGYSLTSAYSTIHGDFSVSNMMDGNSERVILDWEGFRQDFISDDVIKVWLESDDDTKRLIIDKYNSEQTKKASENNNLGSMPAHFGFQLYFALLKMMIRLHSYWYDYFLARDENPEKAKISFKETEMNIQNGLNMIPNFIPSEHLNNRYTSVKQTISKRMFS